MLPRVVQCFLVTVCLFAGLPGADAKDNGQCFCRSDIENPCDAAYQVCVAACQRPNTFSGKMQEGFCKDDCARHFVDCIPDASAAKAKHQSKMPKAGKKAP